VSSSSQTLHQCKRRSAGAHTSTTGMTLRGGGGGGGGEWGHMPQSGIATSPKVVLCAHLQ